MPLYSLRVPNTTERVGTEKERELIFPPAGARNFFLCFTSTVSFTSPHPPESIAAFSLHYISGD